MKSKFFVLMSVALVTLMLTLAVSAQRKNDKPSDKPIVSNPGLTVRPKVVLTCSPGQGKDVSTPLYVKNPTAQDIPAGKVIYWSATQKGTATGKETTTAVLKKNNGSEIKLLGPADNVGSCQAWTY